MTDKNILLILGDQLSLDNPVLGMGQPGRDVVVLAEVVEEAAYVPHNRHKVALIFSAMRHFRETVIELGYDCIYYRLEEGLQSLEQALTAALADSEATSVYVCQCGEYRLQEQMQGWQQSVSVPVHILQDSRFLASHDDFASWAKGKKQLRMEYFYRQMRKRYGILMEADGTPCGGKWNYDALNRKGWRAQVAVPERPVIKADAITAEVIRQVDSAFPANPGDLSRFNLAVTAESARAQFDWFVDNALGNFGCYQDGLAEESPWLFHSLTSMYLNIGLLEPLPVCRAVEEAYRAGRCELADAEGFIRQVLGWREYVRGIYWHFMPTYKTRNELAAELPLPDFFWNGDTDMRCLSVALKQSLDLGYAHHIQRLMVIGNFALLAGLDVQEVCDWYLAVYVDAFEWVELPNTLGMALHADGGIMASKPYAASGKYIQRQGNHCQQCIYDPKRSTGEGACPYNSLYWRFIDRHLDAFQSNPRMNLVVANWRKRPEEERRVIVQWADDQVMAPLAGASPPHR